MTRERSRTMLHIKPSCPISLQGAFKAEKQKLTKIIDEILLETKLSGDTLNVSTIILDKAIKAMHDGTCIETDGSASFTQDSLGRTIRVWNVESTYERGYRTYLYTNFYKRGLSPPLDYLDGFKQYLKDVVLERLIARETERG